MGGCWLGRVLTAWARAQDAIPSFVANRAYHRKLHSQYASRTSGARLVPLVVEVGDRWHDSVHPLLLRLARAYVVRALGLGPEATGRVMAHWAARLSAALLRGNAAVLRRAGCTPPPWTHVDVADGSPLARLVPEGPSAYELFVAVNRPFGACPCRCCRAGRANP